LSRLILGKGKEEDREGGKSRRREGNSRRERGMVGWGVETSTILVEEVFNKKKKKIHFLAFKLLREKMRKSATGSGKERHGERSGGKILKVG